jgi:hypothetical protein
VKYETEEQKAFNIFIGDLKNNIIEAWKDVTE